jgi:hypothetical protein
MKKIPLCKNSKKKRNKYFALVDDEDFEELNKYNWHVTIDKRNHIYACRHDYRDGKCISTPRMHRMIMDCPPNLVVDHINGDGLDNRKENLRICTHLQNCHNRGKSKNNTTGYKGVGFRKDRQVFIARLRYKRKLLQLGEYKTKEEAFEVYKQKATELLGEFANW